VFPRITYKEWSSQAATARYSLTNSGLCRWEEHPDGESGTPETPLRQVPVADRLRGLADPPADADLRDLVAAEYGVGRENVLITCRCQHANFLAVAAARDLASGAGAGRPEVLVEAPAYEPLFRTPEGLGTTVTRFERRADERYALDPDRAAAAATDRTCLVTITNRHNPSGRAAGAGTVADLARVARSNDAYLVVDEVYAPTILDPDDVEATPFGGTTAAHLPGTVVTNSLTKFFGLYGPSVGWIVGDEAFVERARLIEAHTNAVATTSVDVARTVLYDADAQVAESRDLLAEKADALSSFLASRDDLDCVVPDDFSLAFPAHDRADGRAVAEAALDRGVAVFPGEYFGDPDRFRIALGAAPVEVERGLDVLGRVLDGL
jgi:aspartate/methionine/tyrosine aminotransferase